jgi:hypothetical protein
MLLKMGGWAGEVKLPHNPTIPILGIHFKECVLVYKRATSTPMFSAALFTTAKLWKQPRCPTTYKRIKKM